MSFYSISVDAKKQRKAEVLEGILETMETEGGVEDWRLRCLWQPQHNPDPSSCVVLCGKGLWIKHTPECQQKEKFIIKLSAGPTFSIFCTEWNRKEVWWTVLHKNCVRFTFVSCLLCGTKTLTNWWCRKWKGVFYFESTPYIQSGDWAHGVSRDLCLQTWRPGVTEGNILLRF